MSCGSPRQQICTTGLAGYHPSDTKEAREHLLTGFRMPKERLELSWGHPRTILSRLRLPFRHFGLSRVCAVAQAHEQGLVGLLMLRGDSLKI